MLVRFVAAAAIGLSLLEVGLYVAEKLAHHLAVGPVHCALLAIPLVLGIVALIRARAVADWLANKLEE